MMIVALGMGKDGKKTVLGLRQGTTENATGVGDLCDDLAERSLDFSQPRLYVLDVGKALTGAVKKRPQKRRTSSAANFTNVAACTERFAGTTSTVY